MFSNTSTLTNVINVQYLQLESSYYSLPRIKQKWNVQLHALHSYIFLTELWLANLSLSVPPNNILKHSEHHWSFMKRQTNIHVYLIIMVWLYEASYNHHLVLACSHARERLSQQPHSWWGSVSVEEGPHLPWGVWWVQHQQTNTTSPTITSTQLLHTDDGPTVTWIWTIELSVDSSSEEEEYSSAPGILKMRGNTYSDKESELVCFLFNVPA